MKNIWVIKHHGNIPELPGGLRQYEIAEELARRGYNVTYIVSNFHHATRQYLRDLKGNKYSVEDYNGMKLVCIKTRPHQKNDWKRAVNLMSFAWNLYFAGKKITRKDIGVPLPDILFSVNIGLFAPLSSYFLARKHKARFFLDLVDLWPQTMIDFGALKEKGLITKILRRVEKFLYHKSEKIITPLPFVSDYLASLGMKDKAVYLGRWVDLAAYDTAARSKDPDFFTLMYIGAHGPANNLTTAVQSLKLIQDKGYDKIKMVFMGSGILKPKFIKMKEELGIKNLEFRDPVLKKHVPYEISEADAFIFLIRKADLWRYGINPNKMMDYLAAGKPIIFAGDVKNNVVKETGCGISTPPENPQAFAEAVIELYNLGKEERETMGKKGREYAMKNFEKDKVFGDFIQKLGI